MAPPPVDRSLFDAACEIGEAAVGFVKAGFARTDVGVETKTDGSEVTEIDRGAEDLVRRLVGERFPDDAVLGEERGFTDGTSGRRWIVDPIDGTTSFVRRVPLFSTLLAIFDEHGPAVGILGIPALDEFVAAGRGLGCFLNGEPTSVSTVTELEKSCVSASSFDGSWWPESALLGVANSGAKTRTWGDGYGYYCLVTGRVEAMVEPALNTWDIAPMLVIVPEAGGTITTWTGTTELEQGAGWISTNGHIHDQVTALVHS